MDEKDFQKIEEMLQRHIGVFSEDFKHKLDLVVEGHQVLNDKIDRLDTRMDGLESRMDGLETRLTRVETKVDAVAVDLRAHRVDAEAHQGVCRVREG